MANTSGHISSTSSPAALSAAAASSHIEPHVVTGSDLPEVIQYIQPDVPENEPYSPPALIRAIIDQKIRQGIPANQIVVAFDWDGTVTGKKGMMACVRWDRIMKENLAHLKTLGVHLVVVTAAKRNGIPSVMASSKFLKLTNFFGTGTEQVPANADQVPLMGETSSHERVYAWGNIISGESGYDKYSYLKIYMTTHNIIPRIVIFLDDAAHNVCEMRTLFKTDAPGVQYVGIHVPPVDSSERSAELLEIIQSPDMERVKSLVTKRDQSPGEPNEGTSTLALKNIAKTSSWPDWLQKK